MKNLILIAAMIASPLFANAEALRLICQNKESVTVLNIRREFCRISLKQDGSVATLFCGVRSRWDDRNQIFVTRQKNGLSSLSQIENIMTSNLAMPIIENSYDTDDVICRLAR